MKFFVLVLTFTSLIQQAAAQTTITAADMPVAGDTLRYSTANVVGTSFNLNDTGANKAWDYTSLVATAQQVDTYKTAIQVNPGFLLTAPAGCYGYKVADSIPGLSALPGIGAAISVKNLYTFFNKQATPAAFTAVAFGATISGFPVASPYSIKDDWYFFPLGYGRRDSSIFAFAMSIPGLGSLKEGGNRVTRADGWGTVKTPYYTTPVSCLRVRSDVHQVDTVVITALNINLPIPLNTVDYKWLVNGQHYPAVWITTTKTGNTETISSISYRDSARTFVNVPKVNATPQTLIAYPNPAVAGLTKIDVPTAWGSYSITVFDMQSREVFTTSNNNNINLATLPPGNYLARVIGLNQKGYCVINKP
jgi:hypothetical protein